MKSWFGTKRISYYYSISNSAKRHFLFLPWFSCEGSSCQWVPSFLPSGHRSGGNRGAFELLVVCQGCIAFRRFSVSVAASRPSLLFRSRSTLRWTPRHRRWAKRWRLLGRDHVAFLTQFDGDACRLNVVIVKRSNAPVDRYQRFRRSQINGGKILKTFKSRFVKFDSTWQLTG